MYKFLISMLLMMALVGCGQQSSDKQAGDQMESVTPIQDQSLSSTPAVGTEGQQSANPQTEPTTPLPPPTDTSGANTTSPSKPSTTQPTPPSTDGSATNTPN